MRPTISSYDLLLVVALLGTALMALFARKAFVATVFYIVFGLFMALAWVQLGATDVALAEGCVGAGLTGALLIGAIRQLDQPSPGESGERGMDVRILSGLLSGLVLLGLLRSLFLIRQDGGVVSKLVDENLSRSGSSHPVTSMLLNFRSFDTWLELGVLLLASIAAISIHQVYDSGHAADSVSESHTQPKIISRTMLPMLILIGGVLLWFGSHAPGGAFQAGALIGAAGILIQISGERTWLRLFSRVTRLVLSLGFLTFLTVGIFTVTSGGKLLELGPHRAGTLILILELATTLSVALTLNVMYVCGHPWRR